jgi:ribulose-5-phosphate 4-epimerase/fuculose-1-phosphate aldolase
VSLNDEFIDQVVEGCKLFWQKRLTPGRDAGDLSVRDSDTGNVYICPMATSDHPIANWGEITRDDVVVLNRDFEVIDSHGMSETIEAPMHMAIYAARPECNAIVHSHAEWSCAFAACGQNVPAVLVESAFIGGEVICAEYGKVGSAALARNIVSSLGEKKKAALLRSHGAVAIGKDLEEAFIVSDFLEKQAMVVVRASSIGSVVEIDINDIRDETRL